MNYYDALSSEILLTNFLAFPQCGYVKQPYEEEKGDFIFADFVSDELYRRVDRERRRAQELEVPYCLDFERDDLLRYAWLAAHQASSPFIRLMYADSQLMMTRFLGYSVENAYRIDEKNKLALSKSAYQIYHDLYSPDENGSLLQLSIQMRLFICQCCCLVENPDWLEMMGVLFHRTLPIVFRSWATLMGMMGELLARGIGGVDADPEQALQIYRLHNDYYRISKLYSSDEFKISQPVHTQLSYLIQSAFGLKKFVDWKTSSPPSNRSIKNLLATLALNECLASAFSTDSPVFERRFDPTVRTSKIEKILDAWRKAVQTDLQAWDEECRVTTNNLRLRRAYPGSWTFSSFANSKFDNFLIELEDKRHNNLKFRQVLHHAPNLPRKSLLNSGVMLQSNHQAAMHIGQITQLYDDNQGKALYLKCYGYPLYPITWYTVNEKPSAANESILSVINCYEPVSGLWQSIANRTEIAVQWLAMPVVERERTKGP